MQMAATTRMILPKAEGTALQLLMLTSRKRDSCDGDSRTRAWTGASGALHIGGGLGAALLQAVTKRKWVTQDLDSRAIRVTSLGRREMRARFGIEV